jgi:hypothetical protein
LASISAVWLGLWFQLNIASLHIEEEVFESVSGDVTHTICQIPVCNGDSKHWLLRPGRFRLYGLSESTMAASTELATPLLSPSCTNHIPRSSRVKVEPGVESITIPNGDSDVSSPQDAIPTKCHSEKLLKMFLMTSLLALVRQFSNRVSNYRVAFWTI